MTPDELDGLVSGAEIGRRLGISRNRVHKLAARPDFPACQGTMGTAKVWRWDEVKAWDDARRAAVKARRGARA